MSRTDIEDERATDEPDAVAEEAPSGDERASRWTRTFAAVVALVLAGSAAGFLAWHSSRLPGNAAYRVYGKDVTKAELRQDVSTLRAMYGVEPPQGKTALAKFWRDAAQASAVTRVLDHAAVQDDVVISNKQVDDSLAAYVAALYQGSADPQQDFIDALANAGTSKSAVKEEIRRRLSVDALTAKIVADVKNPTPDQVATAFEQRRCTLDVPETRQLRNIVVTTRSQAADVMSDLRSGAAFATVARLKSADGSTSSSGGNIGTVAASQLDAAYAKIAFAARRGAVFGPVRTTSGWNVGQVVKVTPGRTASLAEVAQALQQQLLLENQSRVWQSWLAKEIKAADVKYAGEYRPKDPNAVPAGIAKWADTQSGLCSPASVTQ